MFRKVIGGFDTVEVEKYIADLRRKYEDILAEQKERIFNLVEDNKQLTVKLNSYTTKEQAIIDAEVNSRANAKLLSDKSNEQAELLVSQAIANSKRIVELGITQYQQAKHRTDSFIAACQMYINKLLGKLSPEQLKEFSLLFNKLVLINSQESLGVYNKAKAEVQSGGSLSSAQVNSVDDSNIVIDKQTAANDILPVTASANGDMQAAATTTQAINEKQAQYNINLDELYNVTSTLEQLCKDLGIE